MKNIYIFLFAFLSFYANSQTVTATIEYQGYEESQAYFGEGEFEIFLDNLDGVLDKPIIIMDGFDPGDSKDIAALYAELDFEGTNLADILRDEGFDIVALNFPLYITDGNAIDGGADYIQRNAMVLIELINQINAEKVGSQELVVIGPSMGGLISRYALSYMEQNSLDHETRLFISFDSPHLGANIPVSFQYILNYFAKEQDNTDAQSVVDNVLNSAAAKEMLMDHYSGHLLAGSDFEQDPSLLLPIGAPNFRDAFQTEMDDLGFPNNVRNVSIVNGSGNGTTTGTPGMQIIDTNLDLGNNITIDINMHFTPEAGEINNVTSFTGYFIGIPVSSFDANAESFAFTSGLDSTPGGKGNMTSGLGDIDNEVIQAFLEAIEQEEYSFIPTISAMAIDNENDWYVNPNLSDSPFVNSYIPSINEEHVTITQENADFALEEIREGVLAVNENELSSRYHLIKNPVGKQVKIKVNASQSYSNLEVAIYNISGQQVFQDYIQNPSNEIVLNHTLSSGLYVLNIIDSETSFTVKLMVK